MVDDLWNDNRRLERLLKTEVGATSVALGTASPACVCVCWSVCGCVCLYGMDLIFSVGIQSYNSSHNRSCRVCSADLFTLLLCNYRKTQTMFTPVMAAQRTTVFLHYRGKQQAVLRFVSWMCGLRSWCVGWNCDVRFERLLEIWVHVGDSLRERPYSALCSHIHPINLTKGVIVKLWQEEGRRGKFLMVSSWKESIPIENC